MLVVSILDDSDRERMWWMLGSVMDVLLGVRGCLEGAVDVLIRVSEYRKMYVLERAKGCIRLLLGK